MLKQSNAKKNCVEKTRCLKMLKKNAFLKNSKIELILILCLFVFRDNLRFNVFIKGFIFPEERVTKSFIFQPSINSFDDIKPQDDQRLNKEGGSLEKAPKMYEKNILNFRKEINDCEEEFNAIFESFLNGESLIEVDNSRAILVLEELEGFDFRNEFYKKEYKKGVEVSPCSNQSNIVLLNQVFSENSLDSWDNETLQKMRRVLIIIILLFSSYYTQSQNDIIQDSINNNWILSGKFTFLGNQSSYSYWTAGGQTSVSGTIKIDYDFNYDKNGWNWDTKLITAYGLNSVGGSKFLKKTDDKFEINSLLGKKFNNNLIGNWSYSSFVNFKTQWTKGYRFRKNSQGEEERSELTRFFSPAYGKDHGWNFGAGRNRKTKAGTDERNPGKPGPHASRADCSGPWPLCPCGALSRRQY